MTCHLGLLFDSIQKALRKLKKIEIHCNIIYFTKCKKLIQDIVCLKCHVHLIRNLNKIILFTICYLLTLCINISFCICTFYLKFRKSMNKSVYSAAIMRVDNDKIGCKMYDTFLIKFNFIPSYPILHPVVNKIRV